MPEKYICMREGCSFISEDEPEAIEHFEIQHSHDVVAVVEDDGRMFIRPMGIRSEVYEDYAEEIEEF